MALLFPHLPADLLPEGSVAYIAGGYAACPARASDIDVWVRVADGEAGRTAILTHLADQRFAFNPLDDRREYKDDYGEYIGDVLKVAKVPGAGWGGLDIHIMVTDALPVDLLETFDISTHMVAFDDDRRYVSPQWTALSDEPVALKMSPTTPARLEKITARYADMRTNGKNKI